ncbi:hypothetical protein MNBD_GAMMA26-1781 [hydrothermal vent metagenome]|uniref:Uncharacterized protein n=1 Tax=hydrothermal vent metagenome TaxID=652676 RepID=A0A3B1BHQ7_9ZZZZ
MHGNLLHVNILASLFQNAVTAFTPRLIRAMRKKYRAVGSMWLILPLLAIFLGVVPAHAVAKEQAEEVEQFAKTRNILFARIEKSLLTYDVNMGKKHIIDHYFSPLHAMSVYRELLLWSQANPQDKSTVEDLLGMIREGMVAVVRDSGAGLPLSNWQGSGQPISVPYALTLPRYQVIPDFEDSATLEWAVTQADSRVISPGDVGQSMAVKALMIEIDRSDSGRAYAALFLASALQELDILASRLFMTESLVQEAIKEPELDTASIQGKDSGRGVQMRLATMPKELGASGSRQVWKMKLGPVAKGLHVPEVVVPNQTGAWSVKNDQSVLKSQALLLQGLSHLYRLLSMNEVIEPLLVAGRVHGMSVPEWRKLARRTMDVVYSSMLANHFDATAGSFSSTYHKRTGGQDGVIYLEDASHLMAALETLVRTLPSGDQVSISARKHLLAQAAYVSKALSTRRGLPRGLMLKNGAHMRSLTRSFSFPVAAMSIMLVAEDIAGDGRFHAEITKLYQSTHKRFWTEHTGVYRAAEGARVSAYDGVRFGNTISWLRRMELFSPDAADFDQQVRSVIQVVLKDAGLLQGEGPANGEPRSPEEIIRDDVPAFIATLDNVKDSEVSVPIQEFIEHAMDQDGDGSPGCRYAGDVFGAAPVVIIQVGVNTPFESRIKSGNLNYGF